MKRFLLYICLGIILSISSFIYSNDLEKEKLLEQLRAFRPELQPNEAQLRSMIQDLSRIRLAPHEIRELEQLLKEKVPVGYEKYWEKLNQLPGQIDPLRLNNSNSIIPFTKYNNPPPTLAEQKVVNPVLEDFQVNENVGGRCEHYNPKIAMNSDGSYVVVWCDDRNIDQDIFVQRYNSSGVKQGNSFQVNDDNGSSDQNWPAIAADNDGNFVVVWEDYRNGKPKIHGQRYCCSGAKQGTNFIINDDSGSSEQYRPAIAMDGSGNFVVVWLDTRGICGQRYSSSGVKQGANFVVNVVWRDPAIAMDGSGNFVVVWLDPRGVCGQRYSSSGAKQGANFVVNDVSSWYGDPAIAMDGSGNFVVVWTDSRNGKMGIYGQRYSSSGTKQGINFLINDDNKSSYQSSPAIAVDGSGNFVVVWLGVCGQRYSSSGAKQGASFVVSYVSSWYGDPAIAMDSSGNFVVVWTDDDNNYIYGQQYSSHGAKQGTNFLVNDDSGSSDQSLPVIAVDNDGIFVVAWNDNRKRNSDIYGQQFTSSGIKEGINFLINDDNEYRFQQSPVIAAVDDGNFMVVWENCQNGYYNLYGQRFTSSGAKQNTNFLVNDDGKGWRHLPAIAVDDDGNFVVVWTAYLNMNITYVIYGQRFNSSGAKQNTNFLVNDDSGSSKVSGPAIGMDGSGNFVVVWRDMNVNWNIYGQRYSSSGVKQGTNFLVNDDNGSSWREYPVIAMDDNGDFVVVWMENRNKDYDIYGQRYNSSGVKQGNNFLVNDDGGNSNQRYPAIAMDGNGNFMVVWTDERNGDQDIYAQLYDNTGQKTGANYRVNNDNTQKEQYWPDVKFKNGLIYYCWTDNRVLGQGWDIFARIDQWPFTNSILPNNDLTTARPVKFKLNQNYPNPFNPETTIRYFLPGETKVSLTIFDVNGREMIRLFEGHQLAGEYSFTWNGRDQQRLEVPSGVYLCQLRAGALVERRKMVLIK